MLPFAMNSPLPALWPLLRELRALCVKFPFRLHHRRIRSTQTASLSTPFLTLLRKSESLTPLLSINRFHSFSLFATLFLVTPLFATLTKNTPGYPSPSPQNRNYSSYPIPFSPTPIKSNRTTFFRFFRPLSTLNCRLLTSSALGCRRLVPMPYFAFTVWGFYGIA